MTLWHPFKHFFKHEKPATNWPPPSLPEDAAEPEHRFSPTAAPIHVMSGQALVRVRECTLIVERPDEPDFERPVELVSALHVHGWASVTSPCVGRLTAQGTPVLWRGMYSYPVALALPMHSAGLDVRRSQYAGAGSERGLDIARQLIAAKIVNMRGLMRRRASIDGRAALGTLSTLAKRAKRAKALDALFGVEGAATALYFAAWPQMIAERAGDVEFETRTRRPPRDAVNAMLSYAYAILAGECLCALAATGLDPRLGVLHQPRAGRAPLALDLMEPMRPLIADQAILGGLNTGQLKTADAEEEDGSWLLNEAAKRIVVNLVEKRLMTPITLGNIAAPISYREVLGRQAQDIANTLKSGETFTALERP